MDPSCSTIPQHFTCEIRVDTTLSKCVESAFRRVPSAFQVVDEKHRSGLRKTKQLPFEHSSKNSARVLHT